jgi:membrane protease subunit (stomatin/prohibitin family)
MKIASVIDCQSSNDVFVYKHPDVNFNAMSQLIVSQTQVAAVYYNGQLCDMFGAGRYTLQSQNLPILSSLISIPFDGKKPFQCEVYFVNLIDSLDIKWGTPNRMQIKDPNYNVILSVGANGQFGMRVIDPRNLLLKLVGTTTDFTQANVLKYFKSILLENIKTRLSLVLVGKKISILEVNSHLKTISEEVEKELDEVFMKYGLDIVDFSVANIDVDENSPNFKALSDALNEQARLSILNANYQQERSFDVLEDAAQNEGGSSSGLMQAGMGLGMGVPIGQGVGAMMTGMMPNVAPTNLNSSGAANSASTVVAPVVSTDSANTVAETSSPTPPAQSVQNDSTPPNTDSHSSGPKFCSNCGSPLGPNVNFCSNCGKKVER